MKTWRWSNLLLAPHRLGFCFGMIVLAAASVWWTLVQMDRSGVGLHLGYAVPPSLTHAAVMTFGFVPLFFAGFVFTAGPKWLAMPAPAARELLPALLAQLAGWILWLFGSQLHLAIALAGLAAAVTGLALLGARFWRLIVASPMPDRLHAKVIGAAWIFGCVSLGGAGMALVLDSPDAAQACVVAGLWGFVVVVFAAVAHRMIPFFTSSAVPMVRAWRPFWVLWLLLATAALQGFAGCVEWLFTPGPAWLLARALAEGVAGGMVLWLAFTWGLMQSLKIRLLAMLHLGFLWLGLGLALACVAHVLTAFTGEAVLPLAPLHAVTMGCLGSLMLAMVTRVSCGHSGRPLVADAVVWWLFWLLQTAVMLRLAATLPGVASQWLMLAAAMVWTVSLLAWGIRYGTWYGQPRADGRGG